VFRWTGLAPRPLRECTSLQHDQGMPCLLLPSAENEPKRKSLKPNADLVMKKGFARPQGFVPRSCRAPAYFLMKGVSAEWSEQ
jgi:hypothetical protein